MKKICILFAITLLFSVFSVHAEDPGYDRILEEYQFSGTQELLESTEVPSSIHKLLPDFDPQQLAQELLEGNTNTDLYGVLPKIIHFFIGELSAGKQGIVQILLIAFLSGLLGLLTQHFGDNSIGQIAFMPCYLLVSGIGVSLFYGVAEFVREALNFAVEFMNASLPVYATLLLTTSTANSVGILSPGVTASVFLLSNLINYVIFPAIFLSVMISVTEHLSKAVSIHRLNQFLKKGIRWVLCLVATIFAAFLSIAQVATQSLNGVGGRAGKYVIGNLVPVVGGFLTETLDTLFTCAGVIRSVLGVTGVVILALSFLAIVIRVLARVWLIQMAAALSEPISDARITAFLSDLSEALSLLLGALACAMVSFIIYLTMLMRAGSPTAVWG